MALGVKILFRVRGFPASEELVVARFDFDNSYPNNGYLLTPEMFGLSAFAGHPTGLSALIAPFVIGQPFPLLADCDLNTRELRVYYPTGGANPAPNTPAGAVDPVAAGAVPAGAVGVLSTAAQPTISSALTPGRCKQMAVGTTLVGVSCVVLAIGH